MKLFLHQAKEDKQTVDFQLVPRANAFGIDRSAGMNSANAMKTHPMTVPDKPKNGYPTGQEKEPGADLHDLESI